MTAQFVIVRSSADTFDLIAFDRTQCKSRETLSKTDLLKTLDQRIEELGDTNERHFRRD